VEVKVQRNKPFKEAIKTYKRQFYYNLLLQGNMFRLLRVIIGTSNEPSQDDLIPSALWNLLKRAGVEEQ